MINQIKPALSFTTCSNCELTFDQYKKDQILKNIDQSIAESLPKNLCLDCINKHLSSKCGSAYLKVKEMQKANEQAKLVYQQAYNDWKTSISDYEKTDYSLALIKHLIAQENKPKQVRKTSSKQLSEQEIVEAMLGALNEDQRAALSSIIQSGAMK